MNAATLFSGIGAPEVAMPHWRWLWHAEVEQFPNAVLCLRHPQSINLGDVNAHDFTQRAEAVGRPDIIVFGSPCQSFSIAGERLGLDDPRGNLALIALGIVDRLKPAWFAFENVPGLLSSGDGRDFGAFVRTVDELGYSGAWASLDAQWTGVAQRRERLFFVGHLGDWRRVAAVLFEPESLCGHHPPRRQPGQGAAAAIAGGAAGGSECDGVTADVADPISANEAKTYTHEGTNNFRMHNLVFGGNNTVGPIDVATACRAKGGSGHFDFESESFVATVGTGMVRRLTPRECERLQGFPDDYTLVNYRGRPVSDGPRYKALGNSMAVPVVRWILSRIEAVEQL